MIMWRLKSILPGRRDDILSQADTARDRREYSVAATLYEQVLASNSRNAAVHIQCGHMHKEAGHLRLAEQHYRSAWKLTPTNADVPLQLGHLLKVAGRLDEAAEAYRESVSLAPGWPIPLQELEGLTRTDSATESHADAQQACKEILHEEGNPALAVYRAGLFDPLWYSEAYPDVALSGVEPLSHYLKYGFNEGRDPNSYFDSAWYQKRYLDIGTPRSAAITHYITKGVDEAKDPSNSFSTSWYLSQDHGIPLAGENPLAHFLRVGLAEGRVPQKVDDSEANADKLIDIAAMLDQSGIFDAEWYTTKYEDVKRSGVKPLQHFVQHGLAEGRDPNEFFCSSWYLQSHADVKTSGCNPVLHYIESGSHEGRSSSPQFNTRAYLEKYPVLKQTGGNALGHFLRVGRFDGHRLEEIPDPVGIAAGIQDDGDVSDLFDEEWYLKAHPDVAASGMGALNHYLEYGIKEGLNPNKVFDTAWYNQAYLDVLASGTPAIRHYLSSGWREGRFAAPHFDSKWYARQHKELMRVDENPLVHYLRVGEASDLPTWDSNARYRREVLRQAQQTASELTSIQQHIDIMPSQPTFALYVDGQAGREVTLQSLAEQIYTKFHLVPAWSSTELSTIKPDYLLWIRAGDMLSIRVLYELACAINAEPSVELIYYDDDSIEGDERCRPFYKPDWSPDYLESFNYIGYSACYKTSSVIAIIDVTRSIFDFVLRAAEICKRIVHIRKLLYHNLARSVSPGEISADEKALEARLTRTGRSGTVVRVAWATPCYDLLVQLADRPLVSVVIPTAGKRVDFNGHKMSLLEHCLDTIQYRSTYKNLEIIVVDNGDLEPRRIEALHARGCQTITYTDPVFNVSKKLNLGARQARGSALLLINDDIEPLTPDWVERLLGHLEKPHVGVVGAKLLYPDMTLQHVGVAHNAGNPDHVRRRYPRGDYGYFYSTCGTRNFSAVTGACMMTRHDLFTEVGGYNEELAVSYNDVDFCFKLRAKGFTAVYTGSVEIIHFESQSRVPRLEPGEGEYFSTRWASAVTMDPFYNEENLAVEPPEFVVRHNRRRI